MKSIPVRIAVLLLPLTLMTACGGNGAAPTATNDQAATPGMTQPAPISAEISGAGASFVFPLMSKWSADYNAATGHKINYQSIGSGGGIAQIKAATVDFGSSDKPLSPEELAEAGLGQFPSTIGGVVPVFNLPDIEPGQLRLTGPVLADIFLGRIARWNDPAIAALNPGLSLPEEKISIVHRSDGSGTSFNFTHYLSQVSPDWQQQIGEGTSVQWPSGVGGKGNEGVTSYVQQIKGSIGYVELAYAIQNNLPYASLQNAAGQWVTPSAESFAAAAAGADWSGVRDFSLVITNAPGGAAWPITATNFILMPKQPADPTHSETTLAFFKWAFEQGGNQASELHYVPLPPELVRQIEAYWAQEFRH